MTLVLEVIIGGIGGVLTIGILGKFGVVGCKIAIKEIVRRKKKRKLNKKLSNSIDILDYNEFLDCIYEIKNYDNKYNKYQYNKMKKHYKFNNNIMDNRNLFLRRFDTNYNESGERIANIIRHEIERSFSELQESMNDKNSIYNL